MSTPAGRTTPVASTPAGRAARGAPAPTGPPTPVAPNPAASRAILGFVLRFVGGWVVVIALVSAVPALDRWAIGRTIASLGAIARTFGLGFTVSGSSIQIAGASMQIVADCTPLMPIAALAIAVFAFPAPWRWRGLGLVGGAVLLWVYNLLRIFALVPVLSWKPEWFDFIHVYLWQTMTLLVVFAIFLVWLRLQGRARRAAAPAIAPAGTAS